MNVLRVLAISALLIATLTAQSVTPSGQQDGAFAKLQSLAGDWEGSAVHDGKAIPATTSFRVVADGSAVLDDLAPGTPHEMVTMFHMDGRDLLATHYCSHHNQPRLRALPSTNPNVLEFVFKDATNLASPTDPHMTGAKFTILDARHHLEEWTATANGQQITLQFDFHRKL